MAIQRNGNSQWWVTVAGAALALWLIGCPQGALVGSSATSGGNGAGNGSGNGSSGSGASSNGGSTSSGTPTCEGTATPGPSLACQSPQGGTPVLAGQTVTITCSAQATSVGWGIAVSLDGAILQNKLDSTGTAYVTFAGSALPVGFSDTAVNVTVSASDCSRGSVASTQTILFTLVGNLLATNYETGTVDAYTSDGAFRSNFVGPGMLMHPRMVARLIDGTVLAGGEADANHPGLVHVDANGNPLSTWDSTDHADNPLWSGTTMEAYAAAQEANGTVWVTAPASGASDVGAIHRFSASGAYQDDAPVPADGTTSGNDFSPNGIAVLSSGDIVVGEGAINEPYVVRYSAGGGTPFHVPLAFEICTDPGNGGTVTCAGDSNYPFGNVESMIAVPGGVLVAINDGDEGMLGLFDALLRFQLATAQQSSSLVDRGYYNALFTGLAVSGGEYLASNGDLGCIDTVLERTLFDPMPTGFDTTCWNASSADADIGGMVHLGP